MIDYAGDAGVEARLLEQEEKAEAQRVIEAQAYLRYVNYGIAPEGNYDWYPRPENQIDSRTSLQWR